MLLHRVFIYSLLLSTLYICVQLGYLNTQVYTTDSSSRLKRSRAPVGLTTEDLEGVMFLKDDPITTGPINTTSSSRVSFTPLPSYESVLAVEHLFHNCSAVNSLKQRLLLNATLENRRKHKRIYRSKTCQSYAAKIHGTQEVIAHFYGRCDSHVDANDITLAVQMNTQEDLFAKLQNMTQMWDGVISLALYVDDWFDDVSVYQARVTSMFEKYQLEDKSICLHLVRETQNTTSWYPVNVLRNVALTYAPTDYVLMIEADFITSANLSTYLKTQLQQTAKKTAYVIPVFGTRFSNVTAPKTKAELLKQWKQKLTVPIHDTKKFKDGHVHTKYDKWMLSNSSYKVFFKGAYEPYYVINKTETPFYPEDMLYKYADKRVHAELLHRLNSRKVTLKKSDITRLDISRPLCSYPPWYDFVVLPDHFLVHTPHKKIYKKYTYELKFYRCSMYRLRVIVSMTNKCRAIK